MLVAIARAWVWVVCATLAMPLACGDEDEAVGKQGTLVGGPCASDDDCDGQCAQGGDFPDGMCTQSCEDDSQCPDGTVCIDKLGGSCQLACEQDTDCRGTYECDSQGRVGAVGEAFVCVDE